MTVEVQPEDVQTVLAKLLDDPTPIPMEVIRAALPEKESNYHGEVLLEIKKLIEGCLSSPLRIEPYQPVLLDRLSFVWKLLRQAETCIKTYKGELPLILQPENLRDIFAKLLPVAPKDCFIQGICRALELEKDGRYLLVYKETIVPKKPNKLKLQFFSKTREVNWDNVNRLILWLIRRRRDRYVDIDKEGMALVYFPHLSSEIYREIPQWIGARISESNLLKEKIENQINQWLNYNCIQGEAKNDDETTKEIIRNFSKINLLNTKLVVPESYRDPHDEERIREFEKISNRYAEENQALGENNKKLEEELCKLKQKISEEKGEDLPKDPAKSLVESPEDLPKDPVQSLVESPEEIRDLLKMIDSKYSFDVLQEIQLGGEQIITMKNFLGHLFYTLRKKGFSPYPHEAEFDLPYEQSGLYDCLEFEVSPSESKRVNVVKKGWAIKQRDRILPIRKAQVRLID
jgi:hypothetical protein